MHACRSVAGRSIEAIATLRIVRGRLTKSTGLMMRGMNYHVSELSHLGPGKAGDVKLTQP